MQVVKWMEITCLRQTANKTHPHTSSSSCDKLSSHPSTSIIHSDTPKGRAIKITWGRGEADKIFLPFLSSRCTVAPSCMIKAVCLSFFTPYTLANDMISSRSKYHLSAYWKMFSYFCMMKKQVKYPQGSIQGRQDVSGHLWNEGSIVFGLLIRGRWCSWEWDGFILEIIWLVKRLASGHTWGRRHNTPICV